MTIDKVTLEILRNFYQAIADAMAHVVLRTAHTTFVKETADFATGLVTPDGEIFARPKEFGTTQSLGINLGHAIRSIPKYKPGDIVLTNDPYATRGMSTHLTDLHMFKPIFHGDEIVAFGWTFLHCSDIGGMVPASIAPNCSEIVQEGLRIPPQKLYRAGRLNEDLLQIVQANCRIPEQNWGDLKAMAAGLNTAERRIHEMIEKFGLGTVREGMAALLDYAEERARAVIAQIPDGEYHFVDYLEDEVVSDTPVRFELTMTVSGDRMHLDFTGTDSQVNASFNVATGGGRHPFACTALLCYMLTYDPYMPLNGGLVRAFDVTLPTGSVVNAEYPAACGTRWTSVARMYDVMLGALHQAVPAQLPATGAGAASIVAVSVPDIESGRRKVAVVEPMYGGGGARNGQDGVDACDPFVGFLRNTPIESIENDIPIRVHRYELTPDSAAPGRWIGGHAVQLDVEMLAPGGIITARGMERFKLAAWGVHGGRHGSTGRAVLNPGTPCEDDIGKISVLHLQTGDVFSFRTPSGGGYGDPLERPAEVVFAHVRSGLLSQEAARGHFGVVVHDGALDQAATAGLRDRRRAERGPIARYDLGPARRAYDERIGTTIGRELVMRLMSLPTSVRPLVRYEMHRRLGDLLRTEDRPLSLADLDQTWEAALAAMLPRHRLRDRAPVEVGAVR